MGAAIYIGVLQTDINRKMLDYNYKVSVDVRYQDPDKLLIGNKGKANLTINSVTLDNVRLYGGTSTLPPDNSVQVISYELYLIFLEMRRQLYNDYKLPANERHRNFSKTLEMKLYLTGYDDIKYVANYSIYASFKSDSLMTEEQFIKNNVILSVHPKELKKIDWVLPNEMWYAEFNLLKKKKVFP